MSFGSKAEGARLKEKLVLKNSAVKLAIAYWGSIKHTATCMCNLCQACRVLKIALEI